MHYDPHKIKIVLKNGHIFETSTFYPELTIPQLKSFGMLGQLRVVLNLTTNETLYQKGDEK